MPFYHLKKTTWLKSPIYLEAKAIRWGCTHQSDDEDSTYYKESLKNGFYICLLNWFTIQVDKHILCLVICFNIFTILNNIVICYSFLRYFFYYTNTVLPEKSMLWPTPTHTSLSVKWTDIWSALKCGNVEEVMLDISSFIKGSLAFRASGKYLG